jgi:hypothetical protein
VSDVLPKGISLEDVDIWFQDESRIGQQGSQTRIWAKTGTRPRVVKQQQFFYINTFLELFVRVKEHVLVLLFLMLIITV